jgi:hypothetical protein
VPTHDVAGGVEYAREELEALEGRNELSRDYNDGRIEDWKG